ncbi:MAG: hypothetical protein HC883_05845 [Bdellovibrionaceae bacterium]|nr:hypothetical protein [Pseudobdellovibrionaceae bacterium]
MGKALVLLVLICAWPGAVQAQEVRYIDQNIHQRILFGDSWRGAFVKSFINKDWNVVRFEYCGARTGPGLSSNSCESLPQRELRVEELEHFQEPFVQELKTLRKQFVTQLKVNHWRRFMGGRDDLQVLDKVIQTVEREGLSRWILLRENDQVFPRFATKDMSDRLAQVLVQVLKNPYRECRRLLLVPLRMTISKWQMAPFVKACTLYVLVAAARLFGVGMPV